MTRKIMFRAIRLLLHMMRPARILQTQSYLERVAGIEAIFFPLYNFVKMWSQLARDFNSNASKFYYCSLSKQNCKLLWFIAAISHLSLLNNIHETCNAKYLESPQAQYNWWNLTFDGENKNIYYKSHALISYVCATTGACATPFCFFPSEGGVNGTGASCIANTAAGASCCRALFLATAAATSFGMYFCIPNMQSDLSPDKLYGHASLPSA